MTDETETETTETTETETTETTETETTIPLLEELASQEHVSWSGWSRYELDTIAKEVGVKCAFEGDRQEWIDNFENLECVQRWRRQIETDYANLSEREQESDRRVVRKKWALFAKAATNLGPLVREFLDHAKGTLAFRERVQKQCAADVCPCCGNRFPNYGPAVRGPSGSGNWVHEPDGEGLEVELCAASAIWSRIEFEGAKCSS